VLRICAPSKKKTPNISQTAKTKLEIKPKTKQKPTENVTKASQPTLNINFLLSNYNGLDISLMLLVLITVLKTCCNFCTPLSAKKAFCSIAIFNSQQEWEKITKTLEFNTPARLLLKNTLFESADNQTLTLSLELGASGNSLLPLITM
jgi:hypothetical protein